MRGEQDSQVELLTTTSPGKRVPATHPIREIKRLADQALAKLDSTFDAMYSSIGRPSIPPERLLKAQLLIALYSVRSERQFCERLDYDLLFRFFLDMNLDDPSWDATTVHEEPRPAGPARGGAPVLRGSGAPGPAEGAYVSRALHRRRHAHRGVGRA